MYTRITLDQFYYTTISDTEDRDQDQVLSRYLQARKEEASQRKKQETMKPQNKGEKDEMEESILAVDQLWLWVIDEGTSQPIS